MTTEMEFVNGLIVKAPHVNAPSFVKASLSIKVADLGLWLREKHKAGEEWVNVDVKESKGGKWYASVSTFNPKESNPVEKSKDEPSGLESFGEDCPF